MLHLDPLSPGAPRLPRQRLGALAQLAASAALHAVLVLVAAAIVTTRVPVSERSRDGPAADRQSLVMPHIVFLAPAVPQPGGGGGGGGNQQPAPIRRAQGIGLDAATLRVRPPAPPIPVPTPSVADISSLPAIALDARPMASGTFDQLGLPADGLVSGISTGPGSGGGVGTGIGTGLGSGRGPGLGPGSGGGAGGGAYRAGGTVSAPRLIKEVRPHYTNEALLTRIQGTVVLEAIVTADGCTSQIHVVKSLDRGGLDEEAVAAVAQWRFAPGRLAGVPVDVLVTIMLDFTIR